MPQAMMKHLIGNLYWASPKRFHYPGLYWNTKRIVRLPRTGGFIGAIEFPEQTLVIAKDQPEYEPIPAHYHEQDEHGAVTFCWQFPLRDRLKILFGGVLWQTVWTFDEKLQPIQFNTDKPKMARMSDDKVREIVKSAALNV